MTSVPYKNPTSITEVKQELTDNGSQYTQILTKNTQIRLDQSFLSILTF